MSADLPPVGELVQITTLSGETHLAHLTPFINDRDQSVYYEFDCIKADKYVPTEQVTSWCRVLVLPDSTEAREAATAAAWSADPERVRIDGPWSEQGGTCRTDWLRDIAAALREAAIR